MLGTAATLTFNRRGNLRSWLRTFYHAASWRRPPLPSAWLAAARQCGRRLLPCRLTSPDKKQPAPGQCTSDQIAKPQMLAHQHSGPVGKLPCARTMPSPGSPTMYTRKKSEPTAGRRFWSADRGCFRRTLTFTVLRPTKDLIAAARKLRRRTNPNISDRRSGRWCGWRGWRCGWTSRRVVGDRLRRSVRRCHGEILSVSNEAAHQQLQHWLARPAASPLSALQR